MQDDDLLVSARNQEGCRGTAIEAAQLTESKTGKRIGVAPRRRDAICISWSAVRVPSVSMNNMVDPLKS